MPVARSLRRFAHRQLIGHPRLYARLLRWSGTGSLEKRLFLQLVHRGDTVCDIGANRGDFTHLFSELVGPKGEVHAFEPGPETFRTLTAAVGERANCRLNNMALGDTSASVVLHQPGAYDGQASLRVHSVGAWTDGPPVTDFVCRMSTLDEYAAALTRLDFIKCDVEGAELLVLRGARQTLDRLSPILFVEVHDAWTRAFDYRPEDLVRFLVEAGYDTFYLADDTVRRIGLDTIVTGPANLVCAKPGRLAALQ